MQPWRLAPPRLLPAIRAEAAGCTRLAPSHSELTERNRDLPLRTGFRGTGGYGKGEPAMCNTERLKKLKDAVPTS